MPNMSLEQISERLSPFRNGSVLRLLSIKRINNGKLILEDKWQDKESIGYPLQNRIGT